MYTWEIAPCSVYTQSRDSFGNHLILGRIEEPHDYMRVRMEAVVSTQGVPEKESTPYYQLGMFRAATGLTAPGRRLQEFYESFPGEKPADPWKRAEEWMRRIYSVFVYSSGSTGVATTAEEAFAQGCGVCQDYAHILLALCRRDGLTARYIAGAVPGEGESHAWIEVYKNGLWRGFDPTNHKQTDEAYICFARGRDAGDCSLSRGIFVGQNAQSQKICIKMEEIRQ